MWSCVTRAPSDQLCRCRFKISEPVDSFKLQLHVCAHTHTLVYTCAHTHAHAHLHLNRHVYVSVYVPVYVCTNTGRCSSRARSPVPDAGVLCPACAHPGLIHPRHALSGPPTPCSGFPIPVFAARLGCRALCPLPAAPHRRTAFYSCHWIWCFLILRLLLFNDCTAYKLSSFKLLNF